MSVPPGVPHKVNSPAGARMITIFTPGGFDEYLAEIEALPTDETADQESLTALDRNYDIWPD